MPKFAIRNLAKMPASSAVYPNFYLPADSVNFCGLPLPHVLCNLLNMLSGRGSEARPLIRNLAKIACLSAVYPDFSLRQPPSDSVYFRAPPPPHVLSNLFNMLSGRGVGRPSF